MTILVTVLRLDTHAPVLGQPGHDNGIVLQRVVRVQLRNGQGQHLLAAVAEHLTGTVVDFQ